MLTGLPLALLPDAELEGRVTSYNNTAIRGTVVAGYQLMHLEGATTTIAHANGQCHITSRRQAIYVARNETCDSVSLHAPKET